MILWLLLAAATATAVADETFTFNQNKYLLVNSPKSWSEAEKHCEAKSMQLAVVGSAGEQNVLREQVLGVFKAPGRYAERAWVGAPLRGEAVAYTGPEECPQYAAGWITLSTCSDSLPFICEKEPTCKLPEVKDGRATEPRARYKVDQTVNFRCSAHFELQGAPTLTCVSDATWDKKPPTCKASECPDLGARAGVLLQRTRGNLVGSVARFACTLGHMMQGSPRSVCLSNRKWSSALPICKKCEFALTAVRGCARPVKGQEARFTCSGSACSALDHRASWSLDGHERYSGRISAGSSNVYMYRDVFEVSLAQKQTKFTYDLKVNPKVSPSGTYQCRVLGQTRSITVDFVDPGAWGSVQCVTGGQIQVNAAGATYLRLIEDRTRRVQNVAVRGGRVRIPGVMRNHVAIEVCFCSSEHYPTGCVKADTRCRTRTRYYRDASAAEAAGDAAEESLRALEG